MGKIAPGPDASDVVNPIASYGNKDFLRACERAAVLRAGDGQPPIPAVNVVCAPLAQYCLLGMLCAGMEAGSAAKQELSKALFLENFGTEDPESKMQDFFHLVSENISESRGMHMHASLWVDGVLPEFEKTLQSFWAEVCHLRDYTVVNRLVSGHTQGMIPNLLSRNHHAFLFLAVNCYKGVWREMLDPGDTYIVEFVGYPGGPDQTASFMYTKRKMQFASFEYSQAVLKPYDDNFVAVFVKPTIATERGMRDAIYEVCSKGSYMLDVLSEEPMRLMSLSMPKLKLRYTSDLEENCRALGITSIFETKSMGMALEAEYNGLVSAMPVHVYMEMDEKGTSFAAAAAAGGTRGGGPPSFVLNHPFVLCLFHATSKTPLMLAQIHSVV